MKRIAIFILVLLVSITSKADLNSNVNCMAVYVSLSIGLKNRGKNEESKLVGMAAKSRYLIVASQIGRDEAMSRMKATKYWKQRYPDTDFWQETKRCLREDGVRFKGLD